MNSILEREFFSEKEWDSNREFAIEMFSKLRVAGERGDLCYRMTTEEIDKINSFKHPVPFSVSPEDKSLLYFDKTLWLLQETKKLLVRHLVARKKMPVSQDIITPSTIDKIFEKDTKKKPNPEQVEMMVSVPKTRFHFLTGGPGTGKTTAILGLIAALSEKNLLPDIEEIALIAPTGRAAQRMSESIQEKASNLNTKNKDFLQNLRGTTIHSLLKLNPRTGKTEYDGNKVLLKKLLVIDEVSMISLPMMFMLLRAISDSAIVLFLGDQNQLPSVEKGEMLRDFLLFLNSNDFKNNQTLLQKSYRQESAPFISKAGECVIKGEDPFVQFSKEGNQFYFSLAEKAIQPAQEFYWLDLNQEKPNQIREALLNYLWENKFSEMVSRLKEYSDDIKELKLDSFRCLTIYKEGFYGTDSLNEYIAKVALANHKIESVKINKKTYFAGMPILITKNDSFRLLFNGDTGIVLLKNGELRAFFKIEGKIKSFALDTLPEHSPAFFITVHKSQGSEYDSVCLYLPPPREDFGNSDFVESLSNRRILYTAITRAKKELFITGSKSTWTKAIETDYSRLTGF